LLVQSARHPTSRRILSRFVEASPTSRRILSRFVEASPTSRP
jgi:hypothetical protein